MKAAIVIGILLLLFFLYRPVAKWMVMPAETRASWVEPLATVGTGLHSQNEYSTIRSFDDPAIIAKANEQKRRLLAIHALGKGKYGLFMRYCTIEGDWIYIWLLAEDGKLRYVHDHTRDMGSPPTAVDTYTSQSARLGFMRKGKFVEGEPGPKDSLVLVIQLDESIRSGGAIFY